jgi:hypothetical protein
MSSKQFSDCAYKHMSQLFLHHDKQIGRKRLDEAHPIEAHFYNQEHYKTTDCITYVVTVISKAYEDIGDKAAAKAVRDLGECGTNLAAYLVRKKGWKGIYYNPDIVNPREVVKPNGEGDPNEHVESRRSAVYYGAYNLKEQGGRRKGKCNHTIPLHYQLINFSPSHLQHKPYTRFIGYSRKRNNISAFRRHVNSEGNAIPHSFDLFRFMGVKFGFGLSRGGKHTWLYSYGSVIEVHWRGIDFENNLYTIAPLKNYAWLSGVIVIPPDQMPSPDHRTAGSLDWLSPLDRH